MEKLIIDNSLYGFVEKIGKEIILFIFYRGKLNKYKFFMGDIFSTKIKTEINEIFFLKFFWLNNE